MAADYAGLNRFDAGLLVRFLVGTILFAGGAVTLGIWHFERKDF